MKARKRVACLMLALGVMLRLLGGAVSAVGGVQFSDVRTTDWFYESVQYVCAHGIMNGSGANAFAPQEKTTRGMVVAMLYRYEDSPQVSAQCPFQDVAAGKYYRNAVIWAAENELVGGLGGERFGPDEAVTREQLAAILYRYANYKGYDTQKSAELTKFIDSSDIGSYAVKAVKWAVAEGILSGVSASELQPKGFAVRAQVAAILMRFCEGTASGNAPTESGANGQKKTDAPADAGKDDAGSTTQSGFTLSTGTAEASAGDKKVTVLISVKDNPGILGMRLSVSYDESALTLTGASNGDAVSKVLTLTKAKTLRSGCNFVWDGIELDASDIKDGTVLELQFRVSDSAAAGKYPIAIHYNSGDIIDNDLQNLSPQIQNGYISIK